MNIYINFLDGNMKFFIYMIYLKILKIKTSKKQKKQIKIYNILYQYNFIQNFPINKCWIK